MATFRVAVRMNSKVRQTYCSARLSRLLPVQARSLALLGFQAVSGDRFHAFDFLGDVHCGGFLGFGDGDLRGQGNHTFVGFDFDVGTRNAFFGYQVAFDFGSDPGIGITTFASSK